MTQTVWIIIVEVLLLTSLGLLAMQYVNWRIKHRRQGALERLVNEINETQPQRIEHMVASLIKHYQIDKLTAQELSALLYSSEKQFLLQFVGKQMHDSIEEFYPNLCELLDNFLVSIPVTAVHPEPEPAKEIKKATDVELVEVELNDDLLALDENLDLDTDIELPEDWGDMFK